MLINITYRQSTDETAKRYAAIVESSDDAILAKDLDGTIITWNRGAERLFGYTAAEAMGKPVAMLIPADRPDEEPNIIGRIRQGERIDHYETIRQRKDGSLVDISLSVSPIRNRAGRVIGASKIARDITDCRSTPLDIPIGSSMNFSRCSEMYRSSYWSTSVSFQDRAPTLPLTSTNCPAI